MSFQLALALLLVAASVVYLVLRIVRMLRGRRPGPGDARTKPRPLRRL